MSLIFDYTGAEFYDLLNYEVVPGTIAAKCSKVGSDLVLTNMGNPITTFDMVGYNGNFNLTESDIFSIGFIYTINSVTTPANGGDVAVGFFGTDANCYIVQNVISDTDDYYQLAEVDSGMHSFNTDTQSFPPDYFLGRRLKSVVTVKPGYQALGVVYTDDSNNFTRYILSSLTPPLYTHLLDIPVVGSVDWGGIPGLSTVTFTVHRIWLSKDYTTDPEWLEKPIVDVGTTKQLWTGAEFYDAINLDTPVGTKAAYLTKSGDNLVATNFTTGVPPEGVAYDYGSVQFNKNDKFSFGYRFTVDAIPTVDFEAILCAFTKDFSTEGFFTDIFLGTLGAIDVTGMWVFTGIQNPGLPYLIHQSIPSDLIGKEIKVIHEFNSIVNGAMSITMFYDDMTTPIMRGFVNVSDLLDSEIRLTGIAGYNNASNGADLRVHALWIGDGGYLDETNPTPTAPTNLDGSYDIVATTNDLAWDASSSATSYVVYWSLNPGVTTADNYLPETTNTYISHTGINPNYTYYYRVLARNSYGDSILSNEIYISPGGTFMTGNVSLTPSIQYWGRDIEFLVFSDTTVSLPLLDVFTIYGEFILSGGLMSAGPYANTYSYIMPFDSELLSGGCYYFNANMDDPTDNIMGAFTYDTNGILEKDTQLEFIKATSFDSERNILSGMVDGYYVRIKNPESTNFGNPLFESYTKVSYETADTQSDIIYKNYIDENE
ncbi:MAG: fibronectin type III domain-containing protein [Candidatus Paceibacterota bacterium]|jgi:hypothetical protein